MSEKNKKASDHLRDALEQAIVMGEFAPGTRLDEVTLATRFSVSRTPIREAFQQLAAIGMIELKPRRGAFVCQISIGQIVEMFEVMAELEGMCGRLAARRINESQGQQLKVHMRACEVAAKAGDTDVYYYENECFHYALYEASCNRFLTQQAQQLHRRLKPYRRLQLRVRNRMQQSKQEHRAVVAAVLSGDSDRAEKILKAHVLVQGERLTDLLASLEHQYV